MVSLMLLMLRCKEGESTYCYEIVAYQRADGGVPRGCPDRDSPDYDWNA